VKPLFQALPDAAGRRETAIYVAGLLDTERVEALWGLGVRRYGVYYR
jgi:hypothetical protein